MDGFLCINKPQGPSSFQIIDQLRRILHIKKAGHAGTLDPKASGLLIIAIGSATRLLQYIPSEPKIYQFGIQFGSQTDTLDCEGEIVASGGVIPEKTAVESVLQHFCGPLQQIPPAFSAIKINGIRSYKLARDGKAPDLVPRPITIYSIEMLRFDSIAGEAHMQVSCSGGTYVRSIARDIANKLGTFGFASYVHRVAAGSFSLESAVSSDQFESAEKYIIPVDKVFIKDRFDVTDEQGNAISLGRNIKLTDVVADTVFAFYKNELIAVLKRIDPMEFHPVTVFNSSAGTI